MSIGKNESGFIQENQNRTRANTKDHKKSKRGDKDQIGWKAPNKLCSTSG